MLSAVVRDSEGAVGRDEITFVAAPDTINPEIAITAPPIGFGPHEATDFTLAFRAFDNVKVERLELYVTLRRARAGRRRTSSCRTARRCA